MHTKSTYRCKKILKHTDKEINRIIQIYKLKDKHKYITQSKNNKWTTTHKQTITDTVKDMEMERHTNT